MMKTFDTKEIIREHKRTNSDKIDGVSHKKEIQIFKERKHTVPNITIKGKTKYEGKNELFSAEINKNISKTKGIVFFDGIHKVEMMPVITKSVDGTQENSFIIFKKFNNLDDLTYSFKEKGIKEEIIVKNKRENYSFNFKFKLTNLVANIDDTKTKIFFCDSVTNKVIFKTANLIMEDNLKTTSTDIKLSLDTDILTLEASSEWINSTSRELPITIDPQIEVNTSDILELKAYNQNNVLLQATAGKYRLGRLSTTLTNYIDFVIDSLTIRNNTNPLSSKYTLSFVHQLSTVVPNTFAGYNFKIGNNVICDDVFLTEDGRYILDITKYIEDSSNDSFTISLSLKATVPSTHIVNCDVITTSYMNEDLRPQILCEFFSNSEYEETKYLHEDLSNNEDVTINLHDGNFQYSYAVGKIKDKALEMEVRINKSSITRTNINEVEVIKEAHMGGFKTNLHRYLVKDRYSSFFSSKGATYIDENNRSHYFYERWYYENSSNDKCIIDKENVYLDSEQKPKTRVGTVVYDAKYEVTNSEGLSLISAESLYNYKKQTKNKIVRRFKLQLNGGIIYLTLRDDNTILFPHYTLNSIGTEVTTKPLWYKEPSLSFDLVHANTDTWIKWTYIDPILVQSSSLSTYTVHNYILPVMNDGNGYYVNAYKEKTTINFQNNPVLELLDELDTRKINLIAEETFSYNETLDTFITKELTELTSKIKSVNGVIADYTESRKQIQNSIVNLNVQIYEYTRSCVRFETSADFSTLNEKPYSVLYSNESYTMSNNESIILLKQQRDRYYAELSNVNKKIDEYNVMLLNTEDEKQLLISREKDNISDLIIDKNNNIFGFDYYGKLILISDENENKLQIVYDKEKLIKVESKDEKIEFVYDKVTSLLSHIIDIKGRRLYFGYINNILQKISRFQVNTTENESHFGYTNNKLTEIGLPNSCVAFLTYNTNNKIVAFKKSSCFVFVNDMGIEGSGNIVNTIFDYVMEYQNNKTIVSNLIRNDVSTAYKFDNFGRVINESSTKVLNTFKYEEGNVTFSSSNKKTGEELLSLTLSALSCTKSLTLSSNPTSSTNINKNESLDGKYLFIIKASSLNEYTNHYVTMTSEILDGNIILPQYSQTIEYVNPSNQELVLPIYIPSISNATNINIKISSNKVLSSDWLTCARITKGDWVTCTYDIKNNLIKKISGKESVSYREYTNGKPCKISFTNLYGDLKYIKYEYNSMGNEVYKEDEAGNIKETYYNVLGKAVETREYNKKDSSLATIKKYSYNESGLVKDLSTSKEYSYIGSTDLLSSVKDKNGKITNYGYDFSSENVTSKSIVVDGISNKTLYKYSKGYLTGLSHHEFDIKYTLDHLGRKVSAGISGTEDIILSSYIDNYSYDTSNPSYMGNKVITTFKNGYTEEIIYNKDKLLIELKTYDDITNTSIFDLYTITYDDLNRITKKYKNSVEIESYTYFKDTNTVLVKVVNGVTTTNTIDTRGRIISTVLATNGTSSEEYFIYDANIKDRVIGSYKNNNSHVMSLEYDAVGRVTTQTTDGSLTVPSISDTYEYLKKDGEVTPLIKVHKNSSGLNSEITTYEYDSIGNITRTITNNNDVRYTYDSLSRLIREDNYLLNKTIVFSYDNGGNINSKKEYLYSLSDYLYNGDIQTYKYRKDGWKDQLMFVNNEGFVYDVMGNPTTYRNKLLVWNKNNTLASFDGNSYLYNSNGIRIGKSVGGVNISYYVDNTTILKIRIGTNTLIPIYLCNKLIGMEYNSIKYFYKRNISGDITHILNSSGALQAEYVYDAYGNHAVLNNRGLPNTSATFIGNINPFRYRGYYYDTESGLYYLNSRYYDPKIGRFISSDSLSILDETLSDINGLNLYMYCKNNPVMYVDYSGRLPQWLGWVLTAVVLVALFALTIATLGSAAPITGLAASIIVGAMLGAFISAATNFTVQILTNGVSGLDSWSVLTSTIVGGISGALSGAFGYASLKVTADMGIKFVINAGMQAGANITISNTLYIAQSLLGGEEINLYGLATSTIGGFISGATFSSSIMSALYISFGIEIAGYGEYFYNWIKENKRKKYKYEPLKYL